LPDTCTWRLTRGFTPISLIAITKSSSITYQATKRGGRKHRFHGRFGRERALASTEPCARSSSAGPASYLGGNAAQTISLEKSPIFSMMVPYALQPRESQVLQSGIFAKRRQWLFFERINFTQGESTVH